MFSSARRTGILTDFCRILSIILTESGDKCCTTMKEAPVSSGIFRKSSCKASTPPAEAPIPTQYFSWHFTAPWFILSIALISPFTIVSFILTIILIEYCQSADSLCSTGCKCILKQIYEVSYRKKMLITMSMQPVFR